MSPARTAYRRIGAVEGCLRGDSKPGTPSPTGSPTCSGTWRSYRLSHDDAADAVQNTWLRLLENLTKIDHPEALPGWLATTARREALGVLRRRTREILTRGEDLGVDAADVEASS